MLSYDDAYLYVAASVPRCPSTPSADVIYAGRKHDADLRTFDRLQFAFDIDRDYATWYRFDVDQRGSTRESLWEDNRWNPEWFVAAESDDQHWRIEVAIPFEELVGTAPTQGTMWAVGIARVIPTEAVQTWTHPAGLSPRGETFGLVQFD